MVVGAKVCDLTDGVLWFVCGNFYFSPYSSFQNIAIFCVNLTFVMGCHGN